MEKSPQDNENGRMGIRCGGTGNCIVTTVIDTNRFFGAGFDISGTGELANLHGQGTWEGPGFPISGIDFWGKIHFDPH